MKAILRTTALTLTFIFLHSFVFAQKPTTALQLNDVLAGITDSLYLGGREWGGQLAEARKSKNFSLLPGARKDLENFIERNQLEVVTMKDINGSEKFRIAMLDFLSFELRMIRESFLVFEKFNSKTSDEDINQAITHLQEVAVDESKFLEGLRKTQVAYGKKNGFTIEEE